MKIINPQIQALWTPSSINTYPHTHTHTYQSISTIKTQLRERKILKVTRGERHITSNEDKNDRKHQKLCKGGKTPSFKVPKEKPVRILYLVETSFGFRKAQALWQKIAQWLAYTRKRGRDWQGFQNQRILTTSGMVLDIVWIYVGCWGTAFQGIVSCWKTDGWLSKA